MKTATPLATSLATHVGLVRSNNEDALAEDRELGLLVLADGMGGHQCGEVASGLAVHCIVETIRGHREAITDPGTHARLLEKALHAAQARILESARSKPECQGMGTTAIACLLGAGTLTMAHIGDSRLYRLRGAVLTQLTRDHSLLQELIDQQHYTREEAMQTVRRNVLTRALGIDQALKADLIEDKLEPEDLLLLCSDGLTDMLEDGEIARLLNGGSDIDALARALIEAALIAGGIDNISVILARPGQPSSEPPQAWERFKNLWRRQTR